MAAKDPTTNRDIGKTADGSVILLAWTNLLTANISGTPVELPEWADICVQVVANTAGSATLAIEGSNDGVTWGTLFNAQGVALSFTATAAPKQVVERPRYVRPNLTVVGTSADWTVTMLMRRANPMRK